MNVLHPAGCELGMSGGEEVVVGRRLRSRRIVGEIVWAGKVLGLVPREGKIESAEVEPRSVGRGGGERSRDSARD